MRSRELDYQPMERSDGRESAGGELPMVRNADVRSSSKVDAATLLQAADARLVAPFQYEALASALVFDLVPGWSDSAVLDEVDEEGGMRRLAVLASGAAESLEPRLRTRAADTITRETVQRVCRTGRTSS